MGAYLRWLGVGIASCVAGLGAMAQAAVEPAGEVVAVISAEHGVTTGTLKPRAGGGERGLVMMTAEGGGKEVTIKRPMAVIKGGLFTPEPAWPGAIGVLNIDRFEPSGRPGITSTRVPPVTPRTGGGRQGTQAKLVYQVTTRGGSIIRGELQQARGAEGDTGKRGDFAIASTNLGVTEFVLDEVLAIDVAEAAPEGGAFTQRVKSAAAEPAPATDRVTLANGDVLEGIIERIEVREAGSTVAIGSISGKEPSREVMMGNVRRIRLATAAKREGGSMVWLSSGEVLTASAAKVDAERVELEGTVRPRLLLPMSVVDAVVMEQAGLKSAGGDKAAGVLAVSSAVSGDGVKVIAGSGAAGAEDVMLAAPMRAEFGLPAASSGWKQCRLAGFVVLDEASRTLGTARVRINLETKRGEEAWTSKEIAAMVLTGASSMQRVNLDVASHFGPEGEAGAAAITGRRIVIQVDPAEDGPMQDRIVLRRMMLAGE